MTPGQHAHLNFTALHLPWLVQEDDPGAIGAGKLWFKKSTLTLSMRNDENTGWEVLFLSGSGSQGPQGIQGETGPQGVQGPAGSGFVYRSTWDVATAYVTDDVVVGSDDATYIALQNSTGEDPTTATAFWDAFPLTGLQGPPGAAGPQGATGPQGPGGAASISQTDLSYFKSIATSVLSSGSVDTSNDSTVVSNAIAAAIANSNNMWNGHHLLYFPGDHSYTLNNLLKHASAISNIMWVGDGNSSIIKRVSTAGNVPMATLTLPTRFRIQNLAFDMNGSTTFCGFKVYGVQGYHVEDCRIYDSVNAGYVRWANSTDLFGFLLGAGTLNKDIIFRNNVVEDLQTEFDDIERCLVEGNTFLRQPTSTGFGSFMIAGSTVNICRDVTVRNNTFIDSHARAITFNVDSSSVLTSTWARIVISGNKIIQRRDAARGIQMGANNATWPLTSLALSDLIIENNEITYDAGSTSVADNYMIYLAGGVNNNMTINRARISGNTLKTNGKNSAQPLRLNFLQNYVISGNKVEQGANGFSSLLMDRPINGKVLYNTFQMQLFPTFDQPVIQVTNTLGNNVFSSNLYRGVPGTTLFSGTGTTGDSFAVPTAGVIYGDQFQFSKLAFTPGVLAAGGRTTTTLTTTRGGLGTKVRSVAFSLDLQGVSLRAYFSATNTITFVFFNDTAGEVTLASGDITVTAE